MPEIAGYLTYLWQEMRMTLRTAALYDHDPSQLRTAAEMLALRRVHPDVESAQAALAMVRDTGAPEPPSKRRSLRTWVRSAYLLLVFGGFGAAAIALADQRRDRGHDSRAIARAAALFLSVAIPLGFLGVAIHFRNTVGFNGLVALGALVAVSLVVATAVISSRR